MNFITKTLNRLFKSSNQLELNKIKPLVAQINEMEKNFSKYKRENFIEKTNELKRNISGKKCGGVGSGCTITN